jgi:GAF domain-containing protein
LVLTGPEEPIVSLIRTPVLPGVPAVPAAVLEPGRLDAVRRTGLVGSPADEAFDDLVRLARTLTGARHVAFTVVDAHCSYVKSVVGDGLRSRWTIPVFATPGRFVLETDVAVVLAEADTDEPIGLSPGLRERIGELCCLPVHAPGGEVIGVLSAVSDVPRSWSPAHVDALTTVASALSSQIALRMALADTHSRVGELGAALLSSHTRRDDLEAALTDSVALARSLQNSLLPPVLPAIPGADTAAIYRRRTPRSTSSATSTTCSAPATRGAW